MADLPPVSGVITLLTDFGLSDPFVGVMTGVILSGFAGARVVDLCHGLRPQAIAEASFWLERCYRWFPRGTLHVVVVDPGVGSARRVLAAALGEHGVLEIAEREGNAGRTLGVTRGAVVEFGPAPRMPEA